MRPIPGVLAVALALVLTGCGGADWNASTTRGPAGARTTKPPKTARAKAAEATAERPLVAALVASSKATNPHSSAAEAATTQCIAAAIVHGYGAATFRANGITPNGLRNPDSTLDALPDPTQAQVTAIGTAIQNCRVDLLARALAAGLHVTDPATIACLAGHLGTSPQAHRFLVLAVLSRHVDLAAAHDEVGIISSCVDLADLVLQASQVPVDATIRACVIDAMNGTAAELKDYYALKLSGTDPDTAQQAIEAVGVAINQCRPSAHTGFTVPSG